MKKLYFAVSAALLAVMPASAITPMLTSVDSSKAQKYMPVSGLTVSPEALVKGAGDIRKSPAKSVALESVLGTYEATYTNANLAQVSGEAEIYVDSDGYNNLKLPEASYSGQIDFWINAYDEETGNLTFKQASLASFNTTTKLYQVPVSYNSEEGLSVLTSIQATYNPETKSYTFPENQGLSFCRVQSGSITGVLLVCLDPVLTVPEGDYKLEVKAVNHVSADNKFTIDVTKGADIDKVRVLVWPDPMAATANGVAAALATCPEVTGSSAVIDPVNSNYKGSVMTESGHATAIFGAFDAEGNLKKSKEVTLIVILDGEGWTPVGQTLYNDGVFSQYYNNFSHSQNVIVEANDANPSLYRLVSPYNECVKGMYASEVNNHVMLDTTDLEWIAMPFSSTGLDLGGDGVLVMGCAQGALRYTKAQAVAQGLAGGSIDENKITFPAMSLFVHEPNYNAPGSWGRGNSNYPVEITLPAISLEVTVLDSTETPVEGAEVKLADSEEAVQTDAEGKATLAIPFATGYFGTVNVTATNGNNLDETAEVPLNGAENSFVIKQSTTGVAGIEAADGAAEYYNMQGVRQNSASKGLLIMVRNGKAEKILVK
ncbi:MAG: hypothetical protein K2M87_04835 [Muribaculaceae bacterium]|nr:hypothetical protein [Muribaculaceae bacterium]